MDIKTLLGDEEHTNLLDRPLPLAVRVTEAARLLDIGRSKCYDLIRTGVLPAIRVGKTVRVPLAPLYAWVEKQSADKKEASSG